MEKPIVSVIIPVYNVEDYIEKAVNSICSQTLTDWEMFLIDDGSTDGSGLLCDKLAEDDSRICVIHQENQGAAAARNAGIERASGKYLYFMDGDDWTVADMLYDMVCLAEHYYMDAWAGVPVDIRMRNLSSLGCGFQAPSEVTADVPDGQCAQMVITGYFIETYYNDTDYYIQKQSVPAAVFGGKAEFRHDAHRLFDRNLLYTVWNKLYLASYIRENEIRFKDVHWDDFPFNLDVIRNIERVSVTDHAYYHFIRKRMDSESEKYNPSLFQEREQENENLIGLYDGWRCEVQQYLISEMKEHQPGITQFDDPETESQQPAGESKAHSNVVPDIVKKGAADPEDLSGKPFETEENAADTATDSGTARSTSASDLQNADTADAGEGEAINFLGNLQPPVPVVNIPSEEAEEFISRRYLERVIGCIENITNPSSGLSKKEQRREIKNIISSESVRKALKTARPGSVYLKAMMIPVRSKSASLSRMEGQFISNIKKNHVKLFARLKANR